MRKTSLALIAASLVFSFSFGGSTPGIIDSFDSYGTGPLKVVSSGAWRVWGNGTNDAQVVTGGLSAPNALLLDNT